MCPAGLVNREAAVTFQTQTASLVYYLLNKNKCTIIYQNLGVFTYVVINLLIFVYFT